MSLGAHSGILGVRPVRKDLFRSPHLTSIGGEVEGGCVLVAALRPVYFSLLHRLYVQSYNTVRRSVIWPGQWAIYAARRVGCGPENRKSRTTWATWAYMRRVGF